MEIVNISEARAHLSRLVERASRGEEFVIAKTGRPMVKVIPLDRPMSLGPCRIGFLKGQIQVPADFDTMSDPEVARSFRGND